MAMSFERYVRMKGVDQAVVELGLARSNIYRRRSQGDWFVETARINGTLIPVAVWRRRAVQGAVERLETAGLWSEAG